MSRQSLGDFMGQRSKREPIEVIETKPQDKSLDKIITVRKQRLERFERERKEAKELWRDTRKLLRVSKERWRLAVEEAKEFWQAEREKFFQMEITSGKFRKAKAVYERMKAHASQLHLESKETVVSCKQERSNFFEARLRAISANRQQEKLVILRDEMKLLNRQGET